MILKATINIIALASIVLLAAGLCVYYIGDKLRSKGEWLIDAMLEGWSD